MARARSRRSSNNNSANIGFEQKLWLAADKLRSNMDAAEYKHVVLGLIFLKYISDGFEEHHAKLLAGQGDYAGSNPEDPDEYRAENIFWVPPAARWTYLQNSAKQPTIGKIVDPLARVEDVDVGGVPGLWIVGAHEIGYLDRAGRFRTSTIRRSGPVLLTCLDEDLGILDG